MNVKVVLDGHSTNASEMQHNGMEGIKNKWVYICCKNCAGLVI